MRWTFEARTMIDRIPWADESSCLLTWSRRTLGTWVPRHSISRPVTVDSGLPLHFLSETKRRRRPHTGLNNSSTFLSSLSLTCAPSHPPSDLSRPCETEYPRAHARASQSSLQLLRLSLQVGSVQGVWLPPLAAATTPPSKATALGTQPHSIHPHSEMNKRWDTNWLRKWGSVQRESYIARSRTVHISFTQATVSVEQYISCELRGIHSSGFLLLLLPPRE